MEIVGWFIAAHGVIWMVATFIPFYVFTLLVYFGFTNAGLDIPIAFSLNFFIGFLQFAGGLYLAVTPWRKIILWATLAAVIIAIIVVVVLSRTNPSIFVPAEF
jgi:hypothetical protein